MEYVPQAEKVVAKILCCECGVSIEPNSANMCVACIRSQVDITEGIPKQSQLYWCKFCERYLQPPNAWLPANLESKELLSLCLKKLKSSLSKVRLVDAGFIWTEPHSKRLKTKLTVQQEVMGGAVLQQSFIVEFVIHGQMCDECQKAEAKDFWRACVQVRQRCDHKKTMYYLEQLILKHKAHVNTTGIKPMPDGIDFFYAKPQDARKLVDFLNTLLPCRYQHAQELVTHDTHNNIFDYKHSYSLELVPICKDNIVCLSKKMAQSLGNMAQIVMCSRISNLIHLIDPFTCQIADISNTVYFRDPFESLCQPKQLVEYTVIECELADERRKPAGSGHFSNKHVIADVWVMRSSELGKTDAQQIFAKTHLGHLLHYGDLVMGFDMRNCNANNRIFDEMHKDKIPDVILVKKVFDKTLRRRRRIWKLKHLTDDRMETGSLNTEYNDFLEDLEEDEYSRLHVNIYKDARKLNLPPVEMDMETDELEGAPQVSLQEMLDDLDIAE